MQYHQVIEARFIKRLNRFIAEVEVKGQVEKVHVKNTGRCKELFIEGTRVFLEPAKNPDRKTKYSLVALYKGDLLINIDSQIPNGVAKESFTHNPYIIEKFGEVTFLKPEVTYGKSRFDLYYENDNTGKKGFIEVKGVTLEEDGISRFPDAPTTRGVKHINELVASLDEGYDSYILFVIQMKQVELFQPNDRTDPAFGDALRNAKEKGVGILCFDSIITPDSIILDQPIPVDLDKKEL